MDSTTPAVNAGDETLSRWIALHSDQLGARHAPDPADLAARQEPLLTLAEAGTFTGLSRAELCRRIEDGTLPAFTLTCRDHHHAGHEEGTPRILLARRDVAALAPAR